MFIQNRFLSITLFLLTAAVWFLTACQPTSPAPATAVTQIIEVTRPTVTAVATPIPAPIITPTTVPPKPTETAVTLPSIEPTPDNAPVNPTLTDDFEASLVLHVGGSPQTVAIVDNVAYLGIGARLVLVDVSDPATPQFIGESSPMNDAVRDIAIADNLVYAAAGHSGLVVFDVSDPTAIKNVNAGPNYAGANPANADTVFVADGFAFVRDMNQDDSSPTLLYFDLSQPTQPTLLEAIPLADYSKIDVYNSILAVSNTDEIDFRYTTDPTVTISTIQLAQYTYAAQLTFANDLVYVSTAGSKLIRIYDISNLAQPQKVSEDDGFDLLYAGHTALANGRLFIGGAFSEFGYCSSEIWIADIQQGEQGINFDPGNCLTHLTAVGDILYTTSLSGFQLFDVSNPTQPQLLSTFIHPSGVQNVLAVAANGQYVYTIGSEGRGSMIQTLDMHQPDSLLVGQSLPIRGNSMLDLYIDNDRLVAPSSMGGMNVLDVSDPAAPALTYGSTEESGFYNYRSLIELANNVFYAPAFSAGVMAAIDLSNPANPTIANTFQLGQERLASLVTDGSYLYTLTYPYGEEETPGKIEVFSLANPLLPQQVGMLEWPQASTHLALVEQTLVIGCADGGCQSLYLVDVSDAAKPTLVQEVSLPLEIKRLLPSENGRLYIITPENEVWRLDTSHPEQITAVDSLQLPARYQNAKIVDELLYVAGGDAGLYIFRLPE